MGQVSMVFKGCADSSELDEPMGCQTNVTTYSLFNLFVTSKKPKPLIHECKVLQIGQQVFKTPL